MTPLAIPIEIKINENSLIGISAIPVRKLFFLTCPISFKSHIVISGLKITTRKIQARINSQLILPLNERLDPRSTK